MLQMLQKSVSFLQQSLQLLQQSRNFRVGIQYKSARTPRWRGEDTKIRVGPKLGHWSHTSHATNSYVVLHKLLQNGCNPRESRVLATIFATENHAINHVCPSHKPKKSANSKQQHHEAPPPPTPKSAQPQQIETRGLSSGAASKHTDEHAGAIPHCLRRCGATT